MAQEIGLTARISPEVDDGALRRETNKIEKRVKEKAERLKRIRDFRNVPDDDMRSVETSRRRRAKLRKAGGAVTGGAAVAQKALGISTNPSGALKKGLRHIANEDNIPRLPGIPTTVPWSGSGDGGGAEGGVAGTTAMEPGDVLGVLQAQLGVQEEILAILQDWEGSGIPGQGGDDGGGNFIQRILKRFRGGPGGGMGGMLGVGIGGLAIGGLAGLAGVLKDFDWPDIDVPEIPPLPIPDPSEWNIPSVVPDSWNIPNVVPDSWNMPSPVPDSWNMPSPVPDDWQMPSPVPDDWGFPDLVPDDWGFPDLVPDDWGLPTEIPVTVPFEIPIPVENPLSDPSGSPNPNEIPAPDPGPTGTVDDWGTTVRPENTPTGGGWIPEGPLYTGPDPVNARENPERLFTIPAAATLGALAGLSAGPGGAIAGGSAGVAAVGGGSLLTGLVGAESTDADSVGEFFRETFGGDWGNGPGGQGPNGEEVGPLEGFLSRLYGPLASGGNGGTGGQTMTLMPQNVNIEGATGNAASNLGSGALTINSETILNVDTASLESQIQEISRAEAENVLNQFSGNFGGGWP